VLLAALGILVGWPLARLFVEALGGGLDRLLDALAGPGTVAIGNSLWVSVAVTVLAVGGGLGLALLTERTALPGRRWLQVAIVAPLLIPDYVTAISWARAWGPAGLSDRLFGATLPGLYGPLGIVLVLAVGALPLAYLVVLAGMRVRAEPDAERAARASGAGGWAAFRSITLPLLSPVLAAAAGLVFVTTMNAFGTPAVLGRPAGFATMTTRIYQDLAFSSAEAAFLRVLSLACLLVLIAVAVVAVSDRLLPRGAPRTGASTGPAAPGARAPVWVAGLAWLILALSVAVPTLALVLTALTRAVGLAPVPVNLTLDNFGRALDQHTVTALGNSLLLASSTALAAVALGVLATVISGGRWRTRLATLVTLTFALPGSVLAVAVLLAFGATLRDTLAIIFLAYLAKLWALGQRPVAGAFERLPADMSRAARASGAGPMTVGRTVVLPLLAPALAAGWLLVFVFALHEVTISILLYGSGTATLAVVILNLQQLGDPTVTSALAVLLTALVALATGVLLLVVRRAGWLSLSVR
jgi:iron(III) transport system permease protein